jgi:hypothetical protein
MLNQVVTDFPLFPYVLYVVAGLMSRRKWRDFTSLGRSWYFLIFPLHAIVISTIQGLVKHRVIIGRIVAWIIFLFVLLLWWASMGVNR